MSGALAAAFGIALAALAVLRRSPLAGRLVDHPNERSLHDRPTPRIGGLGLLAGALPVAAIAAPEAAGLVATAAALSLFSALDDARSLPVASRLAAHLAAAVLAVAIAGPVPGGWVAAALAVAAIAWMANLYNFMDGADGLAGGMALIGFGAYAVAALRGGDAPVAYASLALAAGAAGFLAFNFPPARVFLGDAGSVPLGYLAGALGWLGFERGLWPAWFPALVFSPFIADATVTLAMRAARGEPVLRAHRAHHYQRLVLAGWSHRRLAAWAWALMALAAASAIAAREASAATQGAIICAWALAYGALFASIHRRYPRQRP